MMTMTRTAGVASAFHGALAVAARPAAESRTRRWAHRRVRSGYGPLRPSRDQHGDEILALPAGFRYTTFSKLGDRMTDGGQVPCNHDGMAAFAGPNGTTRLIRNHEVRNRPRETDGAVGGPCATRYDPLGVGGTVTVDLDRHGRVVREFVSLNGTIVNCAGGIAYGQRGWLTCEETTDGPRQGWLRKHGYTFFVPAAASGTAPARPLTAMGRFLHEALAVDPRTGFVYQTEDSGGRSGLYRFRPDDRDDLGRGGLLEMLTISDRWCHDAATGQVPGHTLPVAWVAVTDPDPDLEGGAAAVSEQGRDRGAAWFSRLEGIWYDPSTDSFYFASTDGGDAGFGQVWGYNARTERLALLFESPGGSVLDSPANLLVTPRGGILLCEDHDSGTDNRLVGLDASAQPFELAANLANFSEFAGACFSPDGKVLFVNIYGDGTPGSAMTCAITGPWSRGAL